jgi:hypothetical protein
VARWIKRLVFCKDKRMSRTRCDQHIAEGHIDAMKERGGQSAQVWVDADSFDRYIANLPKAKGTPRPTKKRKPRQTKITDTAAA